MRRRFLLALAALLALSACQRSTIFSSDKPSPAQRNSPARSYATLDQAGADASLLRLADLPQEFKLAPPIEEGPAQEFTGGDPACKRLAQAIDREGNENRLVRSEVRFVRSRTDSALKHEVDAYEAGYAEKALKRLKSLIPVCHQYTTGRGAGALTFEVKPIAFAALGEECLAYQFSGNGKGLEITATVVAVRVGNNMSVVTNVEPADLSMAQAQFERIAGLAAGRLERVASLGSSPLV